MMNKERCIEFLHLWIAIHSFIQKCTCSECPWRKYGVNCLEECGYCKNNATCNSKTGSCRECELGYSLPICRHNESFIPYDNIALNKRTDSSAPIPYRQKIWTADKAVDGNTDVYLHHNSCFISNNVLFPFWRVDLGYIRSIYSIRIFYRLEPGYYNLYQHRFHGFALYVSNATSQRHRYLCYKNTLQDNLPSLVFYKKCLTYGRYVTIVNEKPNAFLELCEVEVYGCESGFGVNCTSPCPQHCVGSTCDVISGACFSCSPRWQGKYCKIGCLFGTSGDGCLVHCIGNCIQNVCFYVNNSYARGCQKEFFGDKCNKICTGHCIGGECNQQSGHCRNSCAPGFFGLPFCICSDNCKDKTCNIITGTCNNGCKHGYFNPNCTSRCQVHCKDNCNQISGLCDNGCSKGYYGLPQCTLTCSSHCAGNSTCNSTSGHCDNGCTEGWKGEKCDIECDHDEYGPGCLYKCGSCKNHTACNKVSGECLSGCSPGYLTKFCNESCLSGYYGEDCVQKCSNHCYGKSPCNVTNGYCDSGCDSNWQGVECDSKHLESQLTKEILIGVAVVFSMVLLSVIGFFVLRRFWNASVRKHSGEVRGAEPTYVNEVAIGEMAKNKNNDYQDLSDLTHDDNLYESLKTNSA